MRLPSPLVFVGAQSLQPLRVSEAIHLGMYVSGYAAKHGGFFHKHGLDVTMASAGGIALAIPAVLSGNAAIVVTGAGMSANAVGEGARPFAELPQVRRR
ncbi:ABC transporter substrate-binding protein [Belnapia rosea]|nr:ABC transporter substrate-binding protein [Belnapia rosea]